MPFPLLGLVICSICGYACKKIHEVYQENQKTKRSKYELKTKTLEAAREENKRLAELENKLHEKQNLSEGQIKNYEDQKGEIKKALADPNISKEEEGRLKVQFAFIQTQLDEEIKKYKSFKDELDKIAKDRKKNNDIINNAGANPDDNHWIWQFVTMENIMIIGACYATYTLLKDDKGSKN